jgi:lipopolysaccharide transport system ATP-binding protein
MSDLAVRVEHLAKRYRIGAQRAAYRTLRESMVAAAGAPVRWLRGEHREERTLWALDDVSFEVEQGEALGIIGRNGAGKSTLLKILSRVTKPTRGWAELHGRVGSLLEVGTGFHPELTGRENIYLNGAILGMRRPEIDRKFDEIVAFAETEKFLDTPVKYYSSGMFVRLAFAVAAHLEPEILAVDEVLAVGDAEFQKKCLGKMSTVTREGRTVLFVSHNMAAVTSLCRRGLLIDKGKIEYTGEIETVVSRYLGRYEERGEYRRTEPPLPNQKLMITGARLLNNGMVSAAFRSSGNLTLQIECDVRVPVKGAQIAFELLNETDQCLFSSTNQDLDREKEVLSPGAYILECSFGLRILRSGKYRINISSSIPAVEVLDAVNSVLVFDVLDDTSPMLMLGQGRRGVIFLELPWTTCPKGQSARNQ